MRPLFALWCLRHGIPSWLVPDYMTLAALSSMLAIAIVLRQARRDGADMAHHVHALALAYLAALLGGYVFEAVRALPAAVALGSVRPLLRAGRAAYGGLLGAMLAALLYLRHHRQPIGPFFDRVSLGAGVVFALVRSGCLLSGCDFGRPTKLPWGVRFPSGSAAAIAHLGNGWVAPGAPSLPVHPTQLYEALLGLLASGAAWLLLRSRPPAGAAFLLWLAIYAAGRGAIELVRGDAGRGLYLGLSTAQYVSLCLLLLCAYLASRLQAADGAQSRRDFSWR